MNAMRTVRVPAVTVTMATPSSADVVIAKTPPRIATATSLGLLDTAVTVVCAATVVNSRDSRNPVVASLSTFPR